MDLDYCLLIIAECWLLSSLKRAWLMILSMEGILHQLIWRIFPFFPLAIIYIHIYTNWYKISSINSWTPICSAQGHHPANLRGLSAVFALTRFYYTSKPPTALPAVAQNGSWWWHKAPPPPESDNSWSSSSSIKLSVRFTLMPSFKGNKWLHLSHHMCLQIVMLKMFEVVSNGFRSVSRYFANVWLT